MPVDQSDSFNLDDRDRLPWLEPAGIEEEAEGVSSAKVVGLVLAGLFLLALILGGGYWLKNRTGPVDDGTARLIPAQNGSYKIPANASDSKPFEGEGDESFQASAGGEAGGNIDASRVPEAPRTDLRPSGAAAPAAPPPAARPSVSATVRETAAPPAATRSAAPADAAATADPRIQVGAYNSRALAEGVWRRLSGRFDYLASQTHMVEPVETGGRTLYRLRVTMPSAADAATACGKLRVAGENCMVVR